MWADRNRVQRRIDCMPVSSPKPSLGLGDLQAMVGMIRLDGRDRTDCRGFWDFCDTHANWPCFAPCNVHPLVIWGR